ncbi:hypothetical protein [Streptomyces sp. NPDC018587]
MRAWTQRLFWFTRPGDLLIPCCEPDAAFVDYALAHTGVAAGMEYSVESFTQDGATTYFAVTRKQVTGGAKKVETGHSQPVSLPPEPRRTGRHRLVRATRRHLDRPCGPRLHRAARRPRELRRGGGGRHRPAQRRPARSDRGTRRALVRPASAPRAARHHSTLRAVGTGRGERRVMPGAGRRRSRRRR